ncbi:sugar transferase [Jannaschia ovalis]|uniref:sugar transferase n=1 Tax=Jannaschia ovalis TaxID=3038773 RepID=UPI0032662B8F
MRPSESLFRYDGTPEEAGVADRPFDAFAKWGFDLGMAVLLLPILLPLILVLYVLVRLDGGPGFFGHERVCRNGRRFKCWKLRTMVPDAQAVLRRHLAENPAAAAEWSRDFKLVDDPQNHAARRLPAPHLSR